MYEFSCEVTRELSNQTCRREYVHPIDGQRFPGPHRVIIGSDGEIYYTPDHYQTFFLSNRNVLLY